MKKIDPQLLIIGKNIKRHRKLQNLSQEELAHRACLGLSYYGRVERGEQNFSIRCLLKIAQALHVYPYELLEIENLNMLFNSDYKEEV